MPSDRETLDQLKIHRPATGARSSRGAVYLAVALGLVALGAAGWWWRRPHAVEVETAVTRAVDGGGARTLLNASGYVTARRIATVSSKVTGRVTEVLVEEGTQVSEGEVLARVDSSNAETSLRLGEAQAEAARRALGETEANLQLAGLNLQRTNTLAQARGVSESELDRARAEVASLQARLERQRAEVTVAERQVAAWRQQVDDTVIRAPFAGVVTAKNAQPGEMISPLSAGGAGTRTGICTIVDMASLEVEVDVNESYINRVVPGQPVVVTLDSYPDAPIPAKVIAIIPTADRQKATVRVRVGFEKLDARILPDMGLKVAFQGTETGQPAQRGTAVPAAAVQHLDGRDFVWVVREGQAERRAVTVESTRGEEVVLAAGVQPGETIVVRAPENLTEAIRVEARRP